MSTILQNACKNLQNAAFRGLTKHAVSRREQGIAGLAQLVEHLICNRAAFQQNQSHSCKISAVFPLRSAGVGRILQNAGGC